MCGEKAKVRTAGQKFSPFQGAPSEANNTLVRQRGVSSATLAVKIKPGIPQSSMICNNLSSINNGLFGIINVPSFFPNGGG